MRKKEDIIKIFQKIAGRHSVYKLFDDWVHMLALEISVAADEKTKKDRQEEWRTIYAGYGEKERRQMLEATVCLIEVLEEEPEDVLGWCYMHLETGSNSLGQFFTPFHICDLMAKLSYDKHALEEPITINEPTCGAGGNIIAMLLELKRRGINYQWNCEIVAQDLDWRCVYMCYAQLSLLGARALVVQGNTLVQPYIPSETERSHIFITPAKAGIL